ncbi:VOC family protein [Nitrogeniibacter mangrovi]|uniref:VOC family protein n=1 Tax=Nitrogeniibacter mangrovi TaxID=2016596 RepID=A0A6C1B131_9RHOO|nr:VOC family protein [Nitrogeniibacter mangrovi]QID17063.1 VOC family protein [Nitrogeniibacter mangrovi]
MPSTLTHIALHVRDLDACIAFYRDYAGMETVHERAADGKRVVWLASPGQGARFILVLIPGGPGQQQAADDFSHLGFALDSHAAVDAIAERAQAGGLLEWPPRQEPYPVGYYCGVRDPDGRFVEFSYGQPLGPGAPDTAQGRSGA